MVEENVDQFIFTLITNNLNGDVLDIAAVGQTVGQPLDDPAAAPLLTEPLNDPGEDLITAFDSAQAVPFQNLAGTRRTLFFNSGSRIATLSEPNEVIDELFAEVFAFVDGSSGTLRDSGEPFTYTINPDGSLDVVFGNGDRAKYINLLSRPAGDIVAAEYTLQTQHLSGRIAYCCGCDSIIGRKHFCRPNLLRRRHWTLPVSTAVASLMTTSRKVPT